MTILWQPALATGSLKRTAEKPATRTPEPNRHVWRPDAAIRFGGQKAVRARSAFLHPLQRHRAWRCFTKALETHPGLRRRFDDHPGVPPGHTIAAARTTKRMLIIAGSIAALGMLVPWQYLVPPPQGTGDPNTLRVVLGVLTTSLFWGAGDAALTEVRAINRAARDAFHGVWPGTHPPLSASDLQLLHRAGLYVPPQTERR